MRFSFIHAADLHIDSPLAGLGVKDATVAERFAKAGRKAVENLIEQTIAENAAFLLIAGDIFDGDWGDYATGLFFHRALSALHREGIPAYIVKGNHDAESLISRSLPIPESVTIFGSAKAETALLDDRRVAIHGRSFPSRHVPDDFAHSYPAAVPGFLNIGLLHTALDGTRGHATYAACTADDLRRFGYDYWALGHVHAAAQVSRDPWIVFPGNIQGRSVRETGAKGAMRVTVEDGRIVDVTPIVLDAARWAAEAVDVSGHEEEAQILAAVDRALQAVQAAAGGRPLAVRVTLAGATPLHARLVASKDRLQAHVQAIGLAIAPDCWVEQLRIETSAPLRSGPLRDDVDMLDVEALLEAASRQPEFDAVLADLMRAVADKLPRALRETLPNGDCDLRARVGTKARDYLVGLMSDPAPAER